MAFDYQGLRDATVEPLIAEFGKSATLIAPTDVDEALVDRDGNPIVDRDGNPITVRDLLDLAPWESVLGYTESYAVTVVQTQFKKSDNLGTLIEVGDVLLIVSTQGVTIDPELAHTIKVNEIIYQIVRVDPLYPGSVKMLWYVHGRK